MESDADRGTSKHYRDDLRISTQATEYGATSCPTSAY
jgi:hypothetical protein